VPAYRREIGGNGKMSRISDIIDSFRELIIEIYRWVD
jgi:hypothetical protein